MSQRRQQVYDKYDGHCAYCGRRLSQKWDMQIDHIIPKRRGGTGEIDNLNPSCGRCNRRKNVLLVEEFREEIQMQVVRMRKSSSQYRLAEDFGLLIAVDIPVVFYFERSNESR